MNEFWHGTGQEDRVPSSARPSLAMTLPACLNTAITALIAAPRSRQDRSHRKGEMHQAAQSCLNAREPPAGSVPSRSPIAALASAAVRAA